MDYSTCPICNISIQSIHLQRHANDHFSDEDYASDHQFALQMAAIPPTFPRIGANSSECNPSSRDTLQSESSASRSDSTTTSSRGESTCGYASLTSLSNKETFHRVEGSLITLLRKCLELESEKSVSILSGHVDHFQSTGWDSGWGCGWRNIQMLSSHLLSQRPEAREALYGGSKFVPNISSLQRWLERAWGKGFDPHGSNEFGHKIHGKRSWIGTTECAVLFRSFGLRARIVDFSSKEFELANSCHSLGSKKRKTDKIHGPMDMFLAQGKPESSPTVPPRSESYKYTDISSKKVEGHEVLTKWVWNYFSDGNGKKSGMDLVNLTEKAPLYFQHDGHSRTIVGIQAKHQKNGKQQYNLLILDPAEKTISLEKSLRDNIGWQKLIKRGAHTLKKPQYQLCFIDSGIARGEELEELKTLNSIRHEF